MRFMDFYNKSIELYNIYNNVYSPSPRQLSDGGGWTDGGGGGGGGASGPSPPGGGGGGGGGGIPKI